MNNALLKFSCSAVHQINNYYRFCATKNISQLFAVLPRKHARSRLRMELMLAEHWVDPVPGLSWTGPLEAVLDQAPIVLAFGMLHARPRHG